MKYFIFFLLLLTFSCTKNDICVERGSGSLEPHSDEYYMEGELNGTAWRTSVSGFGLG